MEDEDRGTAPPRNGSATGTRPKAATSKPSTPVEDRTDHLERIVKSVVEYQRRQHDQAEAEFFRPDQRWKAMEHQFQQLQRMAREPATTQATGQSLADLQHVHPPSSRPSTASDPLSNMPFLDLPTPLPRPTGCAAHSIPLLLALPPLQTSIGAGDPLKWLLWKSMKMLNIT